MTTTINGQPALPYDTPIGFDCLVCGTPFTAGDHITTNGTARYACHTCGSDHDLTIETDTTVAHIRQADYLTGDRLGMMVEYARRIDATYGTDLTDAIALAICQIAHDLPPAYTPPY